MRSFPRWVQRLSVGFVAAAAVLVAAADIGYAYYSSQGSGTGTASTGTASIALPTSPIQVSSFLYPDAQITDVHVTVTNTSLGASVILQGPTVGTVFTATPGTAGGTCDTSVVTFTVTTLPAAAIAPGQPADLIGTVKMGANAANACQGATFSIPVTVTGHAG